MEILDSCFGRTREQQAHARHAFVLANEAGLLGLRAMEPSDRAQGEDVAVGELPVGKHDARLLPARVEPTFLRVQMLGQDRQVPAQVDRSLLGQSPPAGLVEESREQVALETTLLAPVREARLDLLQGQRL